MNYDLTKQEGVVGYMKESINEDDWNSRTKEVKLQMVDGLIFGFLQSISQIMLQKKRRKNGEVVVT